MSKTKINESQLDLTNITNRVSHLEQITAGGLVYKGNVLTIDDLPDTDNVNGWFYTVGPSSELNKPEYVWLDDHWEELGTTVRLDDNFATKEELNTLNDRVDSVEANKADKSTTYTKTETDAKIAEATGNIDLTGYYNEDNLVAGNNITITSEPTGKRQINAIIPEVDLSEYAKQLDLAAETSARKEADQALETATAAKYGPDNLTAGAGVEIKENTRRRP